VLNDILWLEVHEQIHFADISKTAALIAASFGNKEMMMKSFADYESMMDYRYIPGLDKSVEKAREKLNWIRGKGALVAPMGDERRRMSWAAPKNKVRRLGGG
jgi:hypothetical protein